jgi:glycosyltransferase involved in cell wall biosynthesis
MASRLLCICASLPPETTPTAIRSWKLIVRLAAERPVTVITATPDVPAADGVEVRHVSRGMSHRLFDALERARAHKLVELLAWPDRDLGWSLRAAALGSSIARRCGASAVVTFAMPYSSGLAGLVVKRVARVPLIIGLDDSPTCTDMHEHRPTAVHAFADRLMEDGFIAGADRVVYVSRRTLERVRERQPPPRRQRLALIRYGADPEDFSGPPPPRDPERARIVYVGGATGWYELLDEVRSSTTLSRARKFVDRIGRVELARLDHRTSSPIFLGRAVARLLERAPSWSDRVAVEWVGDAYPEEVREAVLRSEGLAAIVTATGPVPHEEALVRLRSADILFLTLPRRLTGEPGGRISAKTYEYLMTDRPILAAVPPGENRDYLSGRSGVWIVEPDDVERMTGALDAMVGAKLGGAPLEYDRSALRKELDYDGRAAELARLLTEIEPPSSGQASQRARQ